VAKFVFGCFICQYVRLEYVLTDKSVKEQYLSQADELSTSGPLRMSLVTRLAQLLGQILWSVHMGDFSPVNLDEIQETKPKWWNINLYHSRLPYM